MRDKRVNLILRLKKSACFMLSTTCLSLFACANNSSNSSPLNSSNKPIIVVSVTAEKTYQDITNDTTVNHPCNLIQGYCMGSPVPEVTDISLNDTDLIFVSQMAQEGIQFTAIYSTDTTSAAYTGAKHLIISTSAGKATGDVIVPNELSTYTFAIEGINSGEILILDGKTDYYEVAAWFRYNNNPNNFDVADTIVTDTLFFLPLTWLDTTRSDYITMYVSGINGAVPIHNANANLQGPITGFLFARNNLLTYYSSTIYTRNYLQKQISYITSSKSLQKSLFPLPLKHMVQAAYQDGKD